MCTIFYKNILAIVSSLVHKLPLQNKLIGYLFNFVHWFMKYYAHFLLCFCLIQIDVYAQFAQQAGNAGTTAMHADSSAFVNWASNISVFRGWQHQADTLLGKVSAGNNLSAKGKADGAIVSLGDGGYAVLSAEMPIINGQGYDFAIFENGFRFNDSLYFLELAFVEVSSDGINYVPFAASSLTDTLLQKDAFSGINATEIHNLAGKYIAPFGTPFDLDELKNNPLIDVNNIKFIRITDVSGSVNPLFGSRDNNGRIINDPWPTAFASGGFDLDAVGIIHQQKIQSANHRQLQLAQLILYPNPCRAAQKLYIDNITEKPQLNITDLYGNTINTMPMHAPDFAGVYIVHALLSNGSKIFKLIVY